MPTSPSPCLTRHYLLRFFRDGTRRHLHFIFRLGDDYHPDYVSSLFHPPIGGGFRITHVLSMPLAYMTAARDLRVSEADVQKEFGINRDVHLHMSWLWKTYDELVAVESYEVAARVYMLHLISCTLFANKLDVYIDVWYVCLFNSLEVTNWAWRCAALSILYITLGVATIFETRYLTGYLSLLQVYLNLLFVVDFFFNCYK